MSLPSNILLRIVPRPAVRLAGIRIRTDAQKAMEDVDQLWHKTLPRISKLMCQRSDTATYGVSWIIDAKTCSLEYCAAISPGRGSALPEEFEETRNAATP